ncbi:MAG: cache domain-containing protein, partial [Alphaproteobacteria bacterium]|nr:cache domain-containing protein [Alphaproteobacteria bacterium]
MHLRLKHLLAVIFTVVAIVPVLIMALWVERTALEKEMAAVHEKHLLLAKNMTAALDRYSRDVAAVFRYFAKSDEPDKLMSENATELARSIGFKSIQIVDGTGRLILRLTAIEDGQVHLDPKTIRPLLPKADEELKFSNVLPDAAGHPTILLYQRLATDRVAVAALSTDYFVTLQTAITFGRKGHAAIVDRTGTIIAHPKADWQRAMKNIAKVAPVQKMMAGQSGVTQFYSPAVKKQMISGFTTVARTGWGVMVPQPLHELVEKARGAQQLALAIAFLGVVAAAFISWMLANALIRPI